MNQMGMGQMNQMGNPYMAFDPSNPYQNYYNPGMNYYNQPPMGQPPMGQPPMGYYQQQMPNMQNPPFYQNQPQNSQQQPIKNEEEDDDTVVGMKKKKKKKNQHQNQNNQTKPQGPTQPVQNNPNYNQMPNQNQGFNYNKGVNKPQQNNQNKPNNQKPQIIQKKVEKPQPKENKPEQKKNEEKKVEKKEEKKEDIKDVTKQVENMNLENTELVEDLFEGQMIEVDKTRQPVSLVFIGHVDSGKSTISGSLLYRLGQVDERTIEKYQRDAKVHNRESWFMAYIMDINEEEKEKGKTVEIGKAFFETPTKRFTLLDAPGHSGYIPNLLQGACQADFAGLVIAAKKGEFEAGFERTGSTREHALLLKALGVTKLIVMVNKMDEETVKWS